MCISIVSVLVLSKHRSRFNVLVFWNETQLVLHVNHAHCWFNYSHVSPKFMFWLDVTVHVEISAAIELQNVHVLTTCVLSRLGVYGT